MKYIDEKQCNASCKYILIGVKAFAYFLAFNYNFKNRNL